MLPRCALLSAALLFSAVSAAPIRHAPKPRSVPAARKKPAPAPNRPAAPVTNPMTLEEARMAVAMLDDAYNLVLEEVHHTYPTKPGRPVAATIVRDLQKKMTDLGWPSSRFLAVNAIVMNPDHVARDEFERQTVRAFTDGGDRRETIENGTLRVATPVSLGGSCFSCHWADKGRASRAAISWKIPLR